RLVRRASAASLSAASRLGRAPRQGRLSPRARRRTARLEDARQAAQISTEAREMNGALDAAIRYAAGGWPGFPCSSKKIPMTSHGLHDATVDPAQIEKWWTATPFALIGVPTGEAIGHVVLDVDLKHGVNGFRTLAALGFETLPKTPTVITRSGGSHIYFLQPDFVLRNTTGAHGRGIGPGLDWRGTGGYVVVPSADSGYRWGEWHFGNCTALRSAGAATATTETRRDRQ